MRGDGLFRPVAAPRHMRGKRSVYRAFRKAPPTRKPPSFLPLIY